MTQRAGAMQIEIRELHAELDELREREAALARATEEERERRELTERESTARATALIAAAQGRAERLEAEGLRQVDELKQHVSELLGLRAGLTQALQRLGEDMTVAIARIAAAETMPHERSREDRSQRFADDRRG